MISDSGQTIKSVKFKVWLYDDNKGIVEAAYHPNCRPQGTAKNDWTRKFDNLEELKNAMCALRTQVRTFELTVRREYYCNNCNSVTLTAAAHVRGIPRSCGVCGARGSLLTDL